MTDLLTLPEPVLARLARGLDLPDVEALDLHQLGVHARQYGQTVEARAREIEVRTNSDGTIGLHGYATVYDHAYDVAGGPPYGWSETIVAGACTKSVNENADVRCLFDHDTFPIARTKSGTMSLESDKIGLLVDVPSLDLASPHVQSVCSAMARGDLDEMSFAFRVLRQKWSDDYTERWILECKLYDVSVVTYPANPATLALLRSQPPEPELDAPTRGMSLALALAVADADNDRLRSVVR